MEGLSVCMSVILREIPCVLLALLTLLPSVLSSFPPFLVLLLPPSAEIIMMDNFTVVFRSGSDAHFYVVGDGNEVRREEGKEGGREGTI
mgnify:CR=1 FL=1